jgi:hypothetical protein
MCPLPKQWAVLAYHTDEKYLLRSRLNDHRTKYLPWKLFAVVDGKEEPLTEAEVFHIFQDETVES